MVKCLNIGTNLGNPINRSVSSALTESRTLCCCSKNGRSINMPPSWTIHHTSMVPSPRRSWWGKLSTFLATSRAWLAAVVSWTVSGEEHIIQVFQGFTAALFGYEVRLKPMKFLQDCGSLDCFQLAGQAIRTELCFIPPSPADWMRWEKPSRRFDDTTTWQKPFVFSAAMADLMLCRVIKRTNDASWHAQFSLWPLGVSKTLMLVLLFTLFIWGQKLTVSQIKT